METMSSREYIYLCTISKNDVIS